MFRPRRSSDRKSPFKLGEVLTFTAASPWFQASSSSDSVPLTPVSKPLATSATEAGDSSFSSSSSSSSSTSSSVGPQRPEWKTPDRHAAASQAHNAGESPSDDMPSAILLSSVDREQRQRQGAVRKGVATPAGVGSGGESKLDVLLRRAQELQTPSSVTSASRKRPHFAEETTPEAPGAKSLSVASGWNDIMDDDDAFNSLKRNNNNNNNNNYSDGSRQADEADDVSYGTELVPSSVPASAVKRRALMSVNSTPNQNSTPSKDQGIVAIPSSASPSKRALILTSSQDSTKEESLSLRIEIARLQHQLHAERMRNENLEFAKVEEEKQHKLTAQRHQEEIKNLKRDAALFAELEKADSVKLQELKSRLAISEKAKVELQAELAKTKTEGSHQIQQLEDRIRTLERDIAIRTKINQTLENAVQSIKKEVNAAKGSQSIPNIHAGDDEAAAEIESLKARLRQAEWHKEELELLQGTAADLISVQRRNRFLESEYQKMKETSTNLIKLLQELADAKKRLELFESLREENAQLGVTIKRLESERKEWMDHFTANAAAVGGIRSPQDAAALLVSTKAQLQAALDNFQESLQTIREFQKRREEGDAKVRQLEEQVASLNASLRSSQERMDRSLKHKILLQQNVNLMRSLLSSYEKESATFSSTFDASRSDELEKLRDRLLKISAEIASEA